MLWNYQPTLIGLRFVLSFLILLVPTTAMGLTLPVLIEDPVLRQTNFGRAIGLLYGSNTLGAVAGAVLGEAYAIQAFGILHFLGKQRENSAVLARARQRQNKHAQQVKKFISNFLNEALP